MSSIVGRTTFYLLLHQRRQTSDRLGKTCGGRGEGKNWNRYDEVFIISKGFGKGWISGKAINWGGSTKGVMNNYTFLGSHAFSLAVKDESDIELVWIEAKGRREEDVAGDPDRKVVVSSSFLYNVAYSSIRAFRRCLRSWARQFLWLFELEAEAYEGTKGPCPAMWVSTTVLSNGGTNSWMGVGGASWEATGGVRSSASVRGLFLFIDFGARVVGGHGGQGKDESWWGPFFLLYREGLGSIVKTRSSNAGRLGFNQASTIGFSLKSGTKSNGASMGRAEVSGWIVEEEERGSQDNFSSSSSYMPWRHHC